MKSLKVYSSRTQWWCSSKIMSYLHRCQALLLSCVVSIWRQSPKSVLKCTAAEIVYRGVYCFRGRKSCFLLFGHSVVSNSLWPMGCSMRGFPVLHHVLELAETHVHWVSNGIQPSCPLSPIHPCAFYLSQHQGLFQWVSSSQKVTKVLELQHQSYQWKFRINFLWDQLVWSPCSPRDSQESFLPQFESTNSLALSLLYGPTLISIHDYWKNHRFDYRDFCWQNDGSAL